MSDEWSSGTSEQVEAQERISQTRLELWRRKGEQEMLLSKLFGAYLPSLVKSGMNKSKQEVFDGLCQVDMERGVRALRDNLARAEEGGDVAEVAWTLNLMDRAGDTSALGRARELVPSCQTSFISLANLGEMMVRNGEERGLKVMRKALVLAENKEHAEYIGRVAEILVERGDDSDVERVKESIRLLERGGAMAIAAELALKLNRVGERYPLGQFLWWMEANDKHEEIQRNLIQVLATTKNDKVLGKIRMLRQRFADRGMNESWVVVTKVLAENGNEEDKRECQELGKQWLEQESFGFNEGIYLIGLELARSGDQRAIRKVLVELEEFESMRGKLLGREVDLGEKTMIEIAIAAVRGLGVQIDELKQAVRLENGRGFSDVGEMVEGVMRESGGYADPQVLMGLMLEQSEQGRQVGGDWVEGLDLGATQKKYLECVAGVMEGVLGRNDWAEFNRDWEKVSGLNGDNEDKRRLVKVRRELSNLMVRQVVNEMWNNAELKDLLMVTALDMAEGDEATTTSGRRLLFELLRSGEERVKPIIQELIAREDTDYRVFRLMARLMIGMQAFPRKARPFIWDKGSVEFLQEIMRDYPEAFNQTVEVMAELGESEQKLLAFDDEEEKLVRVPGTGRATREDIRRDIREALRDLGIFGKRLFEVYRNLGEDDKRDLSERVRELGKTLFTNVDYEEVLAGFSWAGVTEAQREDLLIEMAMTCYKPAFRDEGWVKKMIGNLNDENPRMAWEFGKRYRLRQEGRGLDLKVVRYELADGKKERKLPVEERLDALSTTLVRMEVVDVEQFERANRDFVELARQKEEAERQGRLTGGLVDAVARARSELNFRLAELLYETGVINEDFFAVGDRYQRLRLLERVLGHSREKKDAEYEGGIDFQDRFMQGERGLVGAVGEVRATEVRDQVIRILRGQSQRLKNEIGKYERRETEERWEGVVAHMVHSQQAFLERAAQGLCTDDDWERYAQSDNWHLSVVDEKTVSVVGSGMCYDIRIGGVNGMMMRQLNARELLDQGTAPDSAVREMVKAGLGFVKDNGMEAIVLPKENEWHVLGNDRRTSRVIMQWFCKEKYLKKLGIGFSVASDKTVDMVYVVLVDEAEGILEQMVKQR